MSPTALITSQFQANTHSFKLRQRLTVIMRFSRIQQPLPLTYSQLSRRHPRIYGLGIILVTSAGLLFGGLSSTENP
jgi:hypothetical protein